MFRVPNRSISRWDTLIPNTYCSKVFMPVDAEIPAASLLAATMKQDDARSNLHACKWSWNKNLKCISRVNKGKLRLEHYKHSHTGLTEIFFFTISHELFNV